MIAGAGFAADVSIDISRFQPRRKRRAQQRMVEPQPDVARPAVAQIAPERERRILGMQRPDRIGPAHVDHLRERRARRWLQKRIVSERTQRIDIEVSRHDVEVAGEHRRHVVMQQTGRMVDQSIEPVERRDQDPADGRLDILALLVIMIARKRVAIMIGSASRARIATPFHARSPRQIAP